METLLIVAIVVTAIAIVTQAGVLVAMYLLSARVSKDVSGLVEESQKLMGPLERVATNFRSASDDVAEMGKSARQEVHRVDSMLSETRDTVRYEVRNIQDRLNHTMDRVEQAVHAPIEEWSAIASAVSAAVRSFFGLRRRPSVDNDLREPPAA